MLVWLAISWWSGFATGYCDTDACERTAERGFLLLMVLQLLWILATAASWFRRRWRAWGLVLGGLLPPITMVVVAMTLYPDSAF